MKNSLVVNLDDRLDDRSYTIEIAPDLLQKAGSYIKPLTQLDYVIIITDCVVGNLHLKTLTASLEKEGISPRIHIVQNGEHSKSLGTYNALVEDILEQGIERDSLIIAFGGGVIGDLAGFVSASLLRGLRFVQIPTTILSQVDSSVGGKTGINSASGKNLIGAFHQPVLVLSDISVLKTLPQREVLAGYAEIVKYGLIQDKDFFEWLESNGKDVIALNEDALMHAIGVSCQTKAGIVKEDEKENGKRALLNLGHTYGHAMESVGGYDGRILHGEGVSVGMVLAYKTAQIMDTATGQDTMRVIKHLKSIGLPTCPSEIDLPFEIGDLMMRMYKDKKVSGGRLTLILPTNIGDAYAAKDVRGADIESVWCSKLTDKV